LKKKEKNKKEKKKREKKTLWLDSPSSLGNVLEHAALVSVKAADIPGFERNVAQLQGYYGVSESALKYEILGLNLVRLLAANKIAEFHTELELIPIAKRGEKFIQYPMAMEQYMMEGAFHKVISSANQAPSPSYGLFVKMLGETVRVQIAECISHAYKSLSPQETAELLMLANANELAQFESQFDWEKDGKGNYVFGKGNVEVRVPKAQVMAQTLALAEELERIV
jgi:26S proteasome regulatory subunit N12